MKIKDKIVFKQQLKEYYKEIIENIFFSEFKRYNEKASLEDFKLELIKNY